MVTNIWLAVLGLLGIVVGSVLVMAIIAVIKTIMDMIND